MYLIDEVGFPAQYDSQNTDYGKLSQGNRLFKDYLEHYLVLFLHDRLSCQYSVFYVHKSESLKEKV